MDNSGKFTFKKPMKTVDVTPTWEAVLPYIQDVKSSAAREELLRMAQTADKYNVLMREKAAGEFGDRNSNLADDVANLQEYIVKLEKENTALLAALKATRDTLKENTFPSARFDMIRKITTDAIDAAIDNANK